jgi:uncharacterized protein YjbI with pentapeptide repeats
MRSALGRRWQTESGQELSILARKMLLEKDVSGLKDLLGKEGARYDFRGFIFGGCQTNRMRGEVHHSGQKLAAMEISPYREVMLESFDLTEADLSSSAWVGCEFRNCIFERCQIWDSSFYGCTFRDCKFIDCMISHTKLGGSYIMGNGAFIGVEMIRGELSNSYFDYPTFKGCSFSCAIKEIDFRGSQFSDCRFEGKLTYVVFVGACEPHADVAFILKQGIPENHMDGVDFSKARLRGVEFKGVDLTRCKFPDSFLFVEDGARVFERASSIVESEWKGEDKEFAKVILETKFDTKDRQPQFIVNMDEYVEIWYKYRKRYLGHRPGEPPVERFVSLIRRIMDEEKAG